MMKLKHSLYLLFLPTLLFSCSPNAASSSNIDSSAKEEIPASLQIKWADCLTQEEEDYLVFFHSDTCSHCQEIMGDVIAFSHEDIKKTYFANIIFEGEKIRVEKDKEALVGVDNIEEFYIRGTPTIIEVENGVVTANIAGKDDCLTFLNSERLNNKS